METKFTKGEWKYYGSDNLTAEISVAGAIVTIERDDRNTGELLMSREEMEANAKLISAAPEMFEALKYLFAFPQEELQEWANGDQPITITLLPVDFKKALNALNKATL